MEIWEGILLGIILLIVGSFVVAFIDVALEQRKRNRNRERAEREYHQRNQSRYKYHRRGK